MKQSVVGVETKKKLSPEQGEDLLSTLKARFEKNMNRHKGLEWANVQAKKVWSDIHDRAPRFFAGYPQTLLSIVLVMKKLLR